MIKYCTQCGHKHEFTFNAPAFCESCGNAFAGVTPATRTVASTPARPSVARQIQEDTDDTPLPDLSKLDVTVEIHKAPRMTLEPKGDSITVVGGAGIGGEPRPRGQKFNREDVQREIEQQFRRERQELKEEVTPS